MCKALFAAAVTFIIAIFSEANLGKPFNMSGIGIMIAVSVMGGFIIYFNENNKRVIVSFKR